MSQEHQEAYYLNGNTLQPINYSNLYIWFIPFILAAALLLISQKNFLLFHSLAELFAIGVAITLSVVAWYTYPFTKNNYLMYLGCGYIWVALLDLAHTLSYKGISIVNVTTANLAIDFWIAARITEATLLLTAPFFLKQAIDRRAAIALYGISTAILFYIIYIRAFPNTYIEGEGLTSFKIYSEYLIISILLLSIYHLKKRSSLLDKKIFNMVVAATLLTISAEILFTFYVSIFDITNVAGHIFKLFSYWFIFLAIIQTTLQEPFLTLARDASTYDAIPDATLLTDKSGIIFQANKASTLISKKDKMELINTHCHTLFHPSAFSIGNCPICNNISHGTVTTTLELPYANGEKYYDYSLTPVKTGKSTYGMIQTIRDITQRKISEKSLRESEQYNRMLFNSSHIGLALTNLDGTLADINPAFAKITGYPIDKLLKANIREITPEKHKKDLEKHLSTLLEESHYGPHEKEYQHKSGRLIHVRTNESIITKKGQKYILISAENITTEIKNKKKLTQFRAALDNSFDMIFLIDHYSMKFIDVNESATQSLGYNELELHGLGLHNLSNQLTKKQIKKIFSELLTGSKSYEDIDTLFLSRTQNKIPVEIRLSKLNTTDNSAIFIAIARDISSRIKYEAKLRQSAAVTENTAEGIIITDINNNIVATNKAFSEITGYSEQESLGKSQSIIHSHNHEPLFYINQWKKLNQEGRWQGEVFSKKKSGDIFPAWTTISAIYNDDNIVSNYVTIISDISSIKESQERLDFLAYHDPLTRLPNRLLLKDRLEHAIQKSSRSESKVAILFIDLDRFKNINDSLGHTMGDKLLVEVAKKIQGLIRKNDTIARLGGDEFVIIMEDISNTNNILNVTHKLLKNFNEAIHIDNHEIHITISIGISIYPENGTDADTLIKNADTAMYRAKDTGRNECHFYTQELSNDIYEKLTIENALRHAISNNQLTLNYQPKYAIPDGSMTGAEVLLRWDHPVLGRISPEKFIPIAEETGMIIDIGTWVIRSACIALRKWQDEGLDLGSIAINISSSQIQKSNFSKIVKEILEETNILPSSVEFEITETSIMKRTDIAIDVLDELKQLGTSISIDDFGTGYSSLSYLKRLPVDKLKIDRSFVKDIPLDQNDEAISCAVIALGKSLNLKIIAEGIETKEQLDFLLSQGCDEGQGYFYSKPLTEIDFRHLIQANITLL